MLLLKVWFEKWTQVEMWPEFPFSLTQWNDYVPNLGKIQTIRRYIEYGKLSILPERISYFYSGLNNKVLKNIKKLDSLYKAECIDTVSRYWRATVWAGQEYREQFPKRRYNYCDDSLTEIYLLSALVAKSLKSRCQQGHDSFEGSGGKSFLASS